MVGPVPIFGKTGFAAGARGATGQPRLAIRPGISPDHTDGLAIIRCRFICRVPQPADGWWVMRQAHDRNGVARLRPRPGRPNCGQGMAAFSGVCLPLPPG